MTTTQHDQRIAHALRQELLHLAKFEDDLACDELAGVPYWAPTPPSAIGHRQAARALRRQADQLLATIPIALPS